MKYIFSLLNKINNLDKKIYIGLFFIAFITVFSSAFNPLNFREMHVDSSVYLTVSDGIIRGLLPYQDLVDNKGPLLYLINIPGLFLGGLTGIWITELIFMLISVLFAYKTALLFTDKLIAFLSTAFSFTVLLASFLIHIGTEEYSLPFLIVSFYIFTKYYFSPKQDVSFFELTILGACFSCAVKMRLNMFPLWVGFCLIIFIESIAKHRFLLLSKYISGFCIGILIVIIPVFLYLKLNGIFNVFFSQVILSGSTRGFEDASLKETIRMFYYVVNNTYSVIPIFLCLLWIMTNYKQKGYTYYTGYFISYNLMILFLSISPNSSRCNLVLIPFFIPVFIYLINILHSSFSKHQTLKIIVLFSLFFILSNEGVGKFFWESSKMFTGNSGSHYYNTGRIIDENTKPDDKIISLGYNGYIYPFTQRSSASKYFYQGAGINQIPGAKEEFISDILTYRPPVIVVYTDGKGNEQLLPEWHSQIYEMMNKEYRFHSSEKGIGLYGFNIYIRNN
jgi:hypothetical protein